MKDIKIKLTDDEEFVYSRAAKKRNMTMEELFKYSINELIKKESIHYLKENKYIKIEKNDGTVEEVAIEEMLENYDI